MPLLAVFPSILALIRALSMTKSIRYQVYANCSDKILYFATYFILRFLISRTFPCSGPPKARNIPQLGFGWQLEVYLKKKNLL